MRRIRTKQKIVILVLNLLTGGSLSAFDAREEGRAMGHSLQQKGLGDGTASLKEIQNSLLQQPEHVAFEMQNTQHAQQFEHSYDRGRKGEDPLKAQMGSSIQTQASHSHQPRLEEAQNFLKQKHRFKISDKDPVLDKESALQQGHSFMGPQEPFLEAEQKSFDKIEPKILKCRQTLPQHTATCTNTLKIDWVYGPALEKVSEFAIQVTPYRSHHWGGWFKFSLDLVHGTHHVYEHRWRHHFFDEWHHRHWAHTLSLQSSQVLSIDKAQDRGQSACSIVSNHPVMSCQFLEEPVAANSYVAKIQCDVNRQNGPGNAVLHFKGTFFEANKQLVERWEGCEALEAQQRTGFCELVESEPQNLNETRTVEDYPNPITRDHWTEQRRYLCGEVAQIDECETLMQAGCQQIDSRCTLYKNDVCVEYENTFECGRLDRNQSKPMGLVDGKLGFLEGETVQEPGFGSGDFGQALTHFEAATEMAKETEEGLGGIVGSRNNPSVFRGNVKQCRVSTLPSLFRDCCKLKGLLLGFLGGCDEGEKQLAIAALRSKRCVQVQGRYCAKRMKILGVKVCIEKRDSYCCYGSQLSRIIQEIAHQQLGLPWGDAKNPQCQSLTAKQLSRLNFDTPFAKAKLSEILGEVQGRAQQKLETVQQSVLELGDLEDRLKVLEKDLIQERSKILPKTLPSVDSVQHTPPYPAERSHTVQGGNTP